MPNAVHNRWTVAQAPRKMHVEDVDLEAIAGAIRSTGAASIAAEILQMR